MFAGSDDISSACVSGASGRVYKAAAVAQVALHCSLQSCDSRCVRSHALTENRVATSTPLERGKGGRCLGRKQERKGKDGSEMKGNGKGSLEAVLDVFLAKRIRNNYLSKYSVILWGIFLLIL